MFKVAEKLYVAQCSECAQLRTPGAFYIYCCQTPCAPARAKTDQRPCAVSSGDAPSELIPLVNMEIPHYRAEDFNRYLDLMDEHLRTGEVVLVSEQGESRAPSLALLWLAFRGEALSRSSFAAARMDFSRIYPRYLPWPGWVIFFEQEWDAFR